MILFVCFFGWFTKKHFISTIMSRSTSRKSLTRKSAYNKSSNRKNKQATEDEESEKPTAPIIEIWQNTYRIEPQKIFKAHLAKKEIDIVLKENLNDDLKYDDIENLQKLSQKISSEIKEKVKAFDIPRYKIVVQTFIGQLKGQSVEIGSRCLWNANTDNYASVQWKNDYIYVTSMVFATYLE
eukprot:280387_1